MADYRGLVAIILAAGIAISVLALCMGAVIQDDTISNQGAALIETVLGASVGAVATYLGGRTITTRQPPGNEVMPPPGANDPPPGVSTTTPGASSPPPTGDG